MNEKKKVCKEDEDSADYKTSKSGKKYRAHKLVFNKGEDDGKISIGEEDMKEEKMTDAQMKKREDIVKGMKKSFKDFKDRYGERAKSVMYATATKQAMKEDGSCEDDEDKDEMKEALKGNQHKIDKNKNGKIDAHDFKLLRKEETEQIDELTKKTLGNYYAAAQKDNRDHADDRRSGDPDQAKWAKDRFVKRSTGMAAAKQRLNKEGWDDMVKAAKERAASGKTTTATHHDVKKTSTGTVYTKQFDKDGMSKGTGEPAADQKRGRGRPKKDKFSEAVDFLMQLEEKEFDAILSEGFDAFYESYSSAIEEGFDVMVLDEARSSTSFQFTHKPGDAESEKKLADLKKSVKGTGKRVVLQGRLGKDNPNAHKYSKANFGKPGSASTGAHTHQRIKKADAAHHDVYVYNKA